MKVSKLQSKAGKKSKKVYEPTARRYSSADCKNALNLNYYVMAKMRAGAPDDEAQKAKIIDCRLKKGVGPDEERTRHSYDYYLHFSGADRRMDRWIPSEQIMETTIFIEDKKPKDEKKKGKGAHTAAEHGDDSSDEHEGLDPQSRMLHEEATRLKDQCGFDEVERAGGGLVVEVSVGAIATGIERMLSTAAALPVQGENLRQLVLTRYTWDGLTRQIVQLYEELTDSSRQSSSPNLTKLK